MQNAIIILIDRKIMRFYNEFKIIIYKNSKHWRCKKLNVKTSKNRRISKSKRKGSI